MSNLRLIVLGTAIGTVLADLIMTGLELLLYQISATWDWLFDPENVPREVAIRFVVKFPAFLLLSLFCLSRYYKHRSKKINDGTWQEGGPRDST